jgi:hypothetical protein
MTGSVDAVEGIFTIIHKLKSRRDLENRKWEMRDVCGEGNGGDEVKYFIKHHNSSDDFSFTLCESPPEK